jgi:hypothetical protein
MFSFGMFEALALSIDSRKRTLDSGFPPPSRAATVMSRPRRVKILPLLASKAPFLRFIVAHFEWPEITHLRAVGSANYYINLYRLLYLSAQAPGKMRILVENCTEIGGEIYR